MKEHLGFIKYNDGTYDCLGCGAEKLKADLWFHKQTCSGTRQSGEPITERLDLVKDIAEDLDLLISGVESIVHDLKRSQGYLNALEIHRDELKQIIQTCDGLNKK